MVRLPAEPLISGVTCPIDQPSLSALDAPLTFPLMLGACSHTQPKRKRNVGQCFLPTKNKNLNPYSPFLGQ